jgi:hypothetical protein
VFPHSGHISTAREKFCDDERKCATEGPELSSVVLTNIRQPVRSFSKPAIMYCLGCWYLALTLIA